MLIISLKKVEKKQQSDNAHLLLKMGLEKLGIAYEKGITPITKNRYQKPSLAEHPEIRFNLSHAEGIAACLIDKNECGVDCESVRKFRHQVVKRSFTENEKKLIEGTADDFGRDKLFFQIWTLKEAYVKAIGIGISYPLNEIEFLPIGKEIKTNIKDHSFKQYIINKNYILALCTMTKENNTVKDMTLDDELTFF